MGEPTRLRFDQMPVGLPVKEGLPPGLKVIDGKITGVPTDVGIYTFTLELKDAAGDYVVRRFTMAIH